MSKEIKIDSPLKTWLGSVKEEWCDYNGHLNLAYYVVIFDLATDAFYDAIGLGESYKNITNNSWFTAESHVCYLSELFANTDVNCTTQVIGFNSKRMHYFHRMYKEIDNQLVATSELLALHVDLDERKVSNAPIEKLQALSELLNKHQYFPKPKQLGKSISLNKIG